MSAALTRRAALQGSAAAALGLVAGAAPAMAKGVSSDLRTPAADAALIDLAGRVKQLADRVWRAEGRVSTLEDRVMRRCPKRTVAPGPPSDIVSERRDTADEWVLVMRQPLAIDPAREAWRRARDAAKAADERDQAAMRQHVGLPEVERRCGRMRARLHRWAADLAATEPATAAGLQAKASAFLVLGNARRYGMAEAVREHCGLVTSILQDAVRLGGGAVA